MWSHVRRAGRVTALVLPFVLPGSFSAVQSAHAALGGAPMTPPADASVSSRTMHPSSAVLRSASGAASSASASTTTAYTVRQTTLGNGTVVREYLAADGSVFGIAWNGPQMPDLNEMLGSYFPQYVAGVKAARAARGGARGPVAVDQSSLVVQSGGHMGAFSGRAWLPPALPAGVSGSDIQ
ncbi:DUF2844 domain-containing protein [bacterium M00.F.Ca.ET.228.01.1.1]|uniref:DUF2844 domain-containing protein n=1 Tax=Burkholderia sp. (strain CCGE1003) TaxID=640512 RepID=E1TCL6_BURSG|nr:DUF2844 domain-containing protein [Paraburkholderia phenoliruptrix]MBW9130992.1 DUF2844 domain-containing protein [Paraburkholderia ginsengiterrae]TGP45080.1 DUF2844 domain-containing protein [bacterium M00.F.Ca.ET.228.01.1.1]TGS02963.1 DUF2844 domain-containing protein [bacterium M00.F.Ca.ET.191.01.1.1]TGU06345.1 DUF2844 domain-containing protein [bacterium M00.F.Ca.ET.155.01.1.1]MBW0448864.1 DUF2844 domain-containing protein [Paraburkholderia phenoliruptrix]